jgi:hypothetical protein
MTISTLVLSLCLLCLVALVPTASARYVRPQRRSSALGGWACRGRNLGNAVGSRLRDGLSFESASCTLRRKELDCDVTAAGATRTGRIVLDCDRDDGWEVDEFGADPDNIFGRGSGNNGGGDFDDNDGLVTCTETDCLCGNQSALQFLGAQSASCTINSDDEDDVTCRDVRRNNGRRQSVRRIWCQQNNKGLRWRRD